MDTVELLSHLKIIPIIIFFWILIVNGLLKRIYFENNYKTKDEQINITIFDFINPMNIFYIFHFITENSSKNNSIIKIRNWIKWLSRIGVLLFIISILIYLL